MTREEAAIIIGNIPIDGSDQCYSIPEYQEAKTIAIEALKAQPCGDCVSREAVINKLNTIFFSKEYVKFRLDYGSRGAEKHAIECVKALQPITPERPKGEWINQWIDGFGNRKGHCNKCGCNGDVLNNFCPNCGAEMER